MPTQGFGATMHPGDMPRYDFRFTSMGELAQAHQAGSEGVKEEAMPTFVLRNANLLDLEAGKLRRRAPTSWSPTERSPTSVERSRRRPPRTPIYDVRGATLMPGLIDCHVHCMASHVNLALTARMSNAIGDHQRAADPEGHAEPRLHHVRDAGGADYSLAQASEDWMIEAPRIFPSGKALSQTGGHGDFRARTDQLETCACHFRIANIARVVDGVDDVRRAARDELTKGADPDQGHGERRRRVARTIRSAIPAIRWTNCARSSPRPTPGRPM